ncbi:Aste57867_18831 [Aphanomyces stellatus]|uniref:Aste57867_18831 protein n=1 Tax=Aphanomyces stellatus TaxID=120398 RepID=A0A485LD23_9STRA|nr:hypothetical protein As57867_018767 [Aphanomyces stellatus]VFT95565.1 Aste57867_18831 [Aphanomyces stellatus]
MAAAAASPSSALSSPEIKMEFTSADEENETVYDKSERKYSALGAYLRRWRGVETLPAAPEVNPTFRQVAADAPNRAAQDVSHAKKKARVVLWSFVSSFCGIAILAAIQYSVHARFGNGNKVSSIIGSFGATAILAYGSIQTPLAQPRNVILGNTLCSIVGVTVARIFLDVAPGDDYKWLSCALAVSISLVLMQVTDTVHPPGGATALIAVISGPDIEDIGYMYVVAPVFAGSCILVAVSVLINNIERQYPRYWLYKL